MMIVSGIRMQVTHIKISGYKYKRYSDILRDSSRIFSGVHRDNITVPTLMSEVMHLALKTS